MFTVEQIKAAHSNVKTGADYPAFVRDIKALGVTSYETYVSDGHTNYVGANGYTTSSTARYAALAIAQQVNAEQFKVDIEAHQQGKTDFPTFCNQCAALGIEKWVADLEKMTCTYFDREGNKILEEKVPG